MKKNSSNLILILAIGLFFAIAGIYGIQGNSSFFSDLQGSGSVFLELSRGISRLIGENHTETINIIISIISLIAGVSVLVSPFLGFKNRDRLYTIVILVLAVVWLLRILFYFLNGNFMEPNGLLWLKNISLDLIVLSALWAIK